ncbi:MAG: hypothetical protein AAF363_04135 [Bacteroidota bacterium]
MKFLHIFCGLVLVSVSSKLNAQQVVFKNFGAVKVCPSTELQVAGDYNHGSEEAELLIDAGGTLRVSGSFINETISSVTNGTTGEIEVQGDSVFSQAQTTFSTLTINSNDSVKLRGNIQITDRLNFENGVLFSEKDTVLLVFNAFDSLPGQQKRIFGTLENERSASNFFSRNSGRLEASLEDVTADTLSSGLDLGNTGLQVSYQTGQQGDYSVKRNNNQFATLPNGSIKRSYQISFPSEGTNGVLSFRYFDSELDSLADRESNLQLFNSKDNGSSWQFFESQTDIASNEIIASSIEDINGIWTASYCDIPEFTLGDDFTVCRETETELRIQILNTELFTFKWFLEGEEIQNETSQTLQTLVKNDNLTYVAQVFDSMGCFGFDTIEVFIQSLATVNIGEDRIECPGTEITLNPQNDFPAYLWTDLEGTELSETKTLTVQDSGTYILEITDGFECSNFDTLIYEYFPLPISDLQDEFGTCASELEVGSSLENINPGASFTWFNLENEIISEEATVILVDDGTYRVEIISVEGCQNSDTIQAILNSTSLEDLAGSASVNFQDTTRTCGNQITLGQGLAELNPEATYLWSTGETSSTILVTENGFFEVDIQATNGCMITAGTFVELGVDEFVNLGPDRSIACEETEITVGAFGNYLWSTGETAQSIKVIESGEYAVRVIDENGCIDSDTVNIELLQQIDSIFFLAATEAFENDTLYFVALPSSVPTSMLWDFNDSRKLDSLFNFPKHVYSEAGEYFPSLEAVFENGCEDFYDKRITIIELDSAGSNGRLALEEERLIQEVKIYPNPNNGLFSIEVELSELKPLGLTVSSVNGEGRYSEEFVEQIYFNIPMDLRFLEGGIYILNLFADEEKRSFRMIIE